MDEPPSVEFQEHVHSHLLALAVCVLGSIDAIADGLFIQYHDMNSYTWTFTIVAPHPDEIEGDEG